MDNAAFRSFVDEVKARTDIVQLIGQDITLEPAGSVLKGRSPRNRDTDPSFVVWPESQRWHDYSGGDTVLARIKRTQTNSPGKNQEDDPPPQGQHAATQFDRR